MSSSKKKISNLVILHRTLTLQLMIAITLQQSSIFFFSISFIISCFYFFYIVLSVGNVYNKTPELTLLNRQSDSRDLNPGGVVAFFPVFLSVEAPASTTSMSISLHWRPAFVNLYEPPQFPSTIQTFHTVCLPQLCQVNSYIFCF